MFVISVKASRLKWWVVGGAGVLAAVLLLCSVFRPPASLSTASGTVHPGETNAQRRAFLAHYGWETAEDPSEIVEVLIPQTFDEIYTAYQDLQKSQGFDLTPYRGKRVKKWTYAVTNYPGESSGVLATLLLRDGVIIGGDIASERADGFRHGFSQNSALPSEPSSAQSQ